jgi:hypothetical protein
VNIPQLDRVGSESLQTVPINTFIGAAVLIAAVAITLDRSMIPIVK